jgi:pyruvate dehydrogenase E1 component alpha subunit
VREAAGRAVGRARAGEGPTFLECRTYRFFGHHVGDVDRSYYRSKQEEEEWKASRDPLEVLGRWLGERGVADEVALKELGERVAAEVEAGERFALDAPFPDPGQVDRHVYA